MGAMCVCEICQFSLHSFERTENRLPIKIDKYTKSYEENIA